MKRKYAFAILLTTLLNANAQFTVEDNAPLFKNANNTLVSPPDEGLWSVATGWDGDKPTNFLHAHATSTEQAGEWTILKGEIATQGGRIILRDAYKPISDGLVQCVRRYQWEGSDTLKNVTLSVRLKVEGD